MHAINDANAILAFDTPYGNICNIEKVDSNLNTLNVKDIVSRSCQRSQSCKTFYTELSFKIKAFDCTLSNGENTQKVAKMISDACSGKMKNMVDKVQCPENVIGQYQDVITRQTSSLHGQECAKNVGHDVTIYLEHLDEVSMTSWISNHSSCKKMIQDMKDETATFTCTLGSSGDGHSNTISQFGASLDEKMNGSGASSFYTSSLMISTFISIMLWYAV